MKTANEMIENVKRRKAKYETAAKARRAKILSAASCVCVAAAVLAGTALHAKKADATGYKVLLDVNPSIEVAVNSKDLITQVHHLSPEGKLVIGDNALAGKEISEGVGNLIGEMVEQGYISQEANSVLVSIEGAQKDKAEKVKANLTEKITDQLTEREVEGSVIVQEIPGDSALKDTSSQYGISPGKAQLIAQIIARNALHTYDELAGLSIHELNVLRQSYYVNLSNVQVSGEPSMLTYIGEQAAVQTATADAGITPAATETELLCHNGMMIYCVEFETETHEYRYRINAVTGEIATAEKVEIGKDTFTQGENAIATVGENAALNAALAHAGVENGKLIRCKYKTDWVDGTVIYDLYFTDGKTAGTYVLNARTGQILKYKATQEPKDRSITATVIGETKAKEIALAKDGLVDGNISKYEMVLTKADSGYVYDLNYICSGVRYVVQVAADDGAVLAYERIVLKETGAPSVETGDQKPAEG